MADSAPKVVYFCPTCGNVPHEQWRDTGESYFGVESSADDDEETEEVEQQQRPQPQRRPKEPNKETTEDWYYLPEKCVAHLRKPPPPPEEFDSPDFFHVAEDEIDQQPNSSDVRTETGCQYFGTGAPCEEVKGVIPSFPLDDGSGYPSVKYYCTPSTENVAPERKRSTGLSYFGGIDYRSVRYFCPGTCEFLPPEPERDTGRDQFTGSAYEEHPYRVNPVPEFGNLSHVRVITGCRYFGHDLCVEKLAPPPTESPHSVRYFCPGECRELPPEQPRETGYLYFGKQPGAVTKEDSLADFLDPDKPDEYTPVRYFCTPSAENVLEQLPRETGKRFFQVRPKSAEPRMQHPRADVRYYYYGPPTDRVALQRARETGSREFGPPDTSLEGYGDNLSDQRTETGCLYYSGQPCVDILEADKPAEKPPPEKYFCPAPCYHMKPELPRDTGEAYFGPVGPTPAPSDETVASAAAEVSDYDFDDYVFNLSDVRAHTGYRYFSGLEEKMEYHVRYFCPGPCSHMPPEPVRATGSDYFGPEAIARLGPISSRLGFMANSSDVRTETGCRYYGGGVPCIEVRGWDRVPRCLTWTREQVAGWIELLGFTNYRDCFIDNDITGRRLILVDASTLPKLGITNIAHIKKIMQALRDLLQVEKIEWNRCIRSPPREKLAMFLEAKSFSGSDADRLTVDKFYEDWEHLKFQPPLCNQGLLLPRN